MKMKVGIIGSTGFLGRSIIECLNLKKIDLFAYSRTQKHQFFQNVTYNNFNMNNPNFSNIIDLDCLILAASETTPQNNPNDYELEVNKNILPHIHLFKNLQESNIKHIIYFSSGGEVYGNSNKNLLFENDQPNPITPYGYGKLCIEQALKSLWSKPQKKYTILRVSNPVGKYQIKKNSVKGLIANIITRLNKKQDILVHGNGNAVRDFFMVEDLCCLVERIINNKSSKNEIINVSSGVGNSINEIIDHTFKIYGIKVPIIYNHDLCPAISRNVLSNSYACNNYNWKPEIKIERIIEAILQFTKSK